MYLFTITHCVKIMKLCITICIIHGIFILYVCTMADQRIRSKENKKSGEKGNKYILQWTNKTRAPFHYLGEGNSSFIKNKCKHQNCYVTDDVSFMDVEDFDAVIFNGRDVIHLDASRLPQSRSSKQKYIIAATESADRFPACNEVLDNFFNWTWTYRLNSDLRYGYVTIYDLEGNEVGPAIDMKWPEVMDPLSEALRAKLSNKSKAAAWYVSNCRTNSRREDFVANLNKELSQFGWNVDIYGACGNLTCARKKWRDCDKILETKYFFYLAFENSFDEDYVTEKVLTGLNNYAVPIVYGSADYSRFLPPASYLNAMELGPQKLARVMKELITDKDKYYEFFRWRNHFTFKQTLTNTDVCKLCEALNDRQKVNTVSVWAEFRRWWNGAFGFDKC